MGVGKILLPPPLKPGDLLQAIAPSGALREFAAFERGLEIWRNRGYRVELASNWDSRCGYLAGTDKQRREALISAWQNPECKGILCIRGGYGGTRLLEDGSFSALIARTASVGNIKWLIGFSDVTALLWSLACVGVGGVHAPVLTTLAQEPDWSWQRLFDCVEGRPLEPLQGKGWGGSKVTGRLISANLTVATSMLNTPWQPDLAGSILALEDVTEAPYRIDRMLTQWRASGAFKGVKGIALGRFSRCESPSGIASWTVEEVFCDRMGDLGIPVVSDLPFGHDGPNAALPVGQLVELDPQAGLLSYLL